MTCPGALLLFSKPYLGPRPRAAAAAAASHSITSGDGSRTRDAKRERTRGEKNNNNNNEQRKNTGKDEDSTNSVRFDLPRENRRARGCAARARYGERAVALGPLAARKVIRVRK